MNFNETDNGARYWCFVLGFHDLIKPWLGTNSWIWIENGHITMIQYIYIITLYHIVLYFCIGKACPLPGKCSQPHLASYKVLKLAKYYKTLNFFKVILARITTFLYSKLMRSLTYSYFHYDLSCTEMHVC